MEQLLVFKLNKNAQVRRITEVTFIDEPRFTKLLDMKI
jgi:hypothetical protein